jgi:hypothetical protein
MLPVLPKRIGVLVDMIKLRYLAGLLPPVDGHTRLQAALEMVKQECAETRILEIAELAEVLEADGLQKGPEVLERIARVRGPFPHELSEKTTFEYDWVTHILERHDPAYLKGGPLLLDGALALASLWGSYKAATLGRWPPKEALTEPWQIESYAGIVRKGGKDDVTWPQFTRTLADLDILLEEYSGRATVDVRRLKARANAGDILHGFDTSRHGWELMGRRGGIALVRDGQCIDYIITMM